MNRSYALVWNEAQQAYVPAPEGSRTRGKRSGGTVVAAAVALLMASGGAHALDATALPTGGQVVQGQANLTQSGATLQVRQGTDRAALNWQSFNIGRDAKVVFVQPSGSSIALNRVVGQDPTQIFGQLNANGQVFLVNPNGVLFAPGAQVSAAGVLASTRDIGIADFASGNFQFAGSGSGTVVNQGDIQVGQGGYVALIGAQVRNEGSIQAPGGDVRLAAADKVSVRLDQGSLTGLAVEQGTLDALAANQGLIKADGGRIYLTADAADALAKAAVNNTGVLEAQTVANVGGVIKLLGSPDNSQVSVGGKVDVSASQGRAGQVIATGHDVAVEEGARIDARGAAGGGEVLIGGGWQGQDARVANASTVVVKRDAGIDASATGTGDGGTVVLWSQDYTGFFGTIGASGGAGGGNGGQVETSSHGVLNALGQAQAQARTAGGLAGVWLLDPSNVTIAASGASGSAYSSNYNPSQDSTILASSIVNALLSTNVTITTGTGASAGNITVAAPIAATHGDYTRTLTLNAANDINVNAAISSVNSRLNVVFNPDTDNSGAGNVNFGAAGRVSTNGGNFYIGSTTSNASTDTVARRGQDVTMAAGSYVDVGSASFGYSGMLDIKVNGTVTLSANSLRNTQGWATYYNQGNNINPGAFVNISAGTITSSNTDPATADITTLKNATLSAGTIGSALNPIKISGGTSSGSATLNVVNTAGSSYVNQVGYQAFNSIGVTVGSQLDSTQNLQIMGDAGGDGSTGTGHLLLNNDGAGVLNLVGGDVKTAGRTGVGAVAATSVTLTAPTMTFADAAVDTGTASFTANATTMSSVAPANNVAEVLSSNVTLNGITIGTSNRPMELATNNSSGSLGIYNSGGSTYVKSINDYYTSVTMQHVKDVGTHSVLFSGGDHIDIVSDGSAVYVPTVTGGASDGSTFGATTGVDLTRRIRTFTLRASTGDMIFADNGVNSIHDVNFSIERYNATGVIAAENTYNAGSPVAQITAGSVSFTASNDLTPTVTTIGAGGKDIQIARNANATGDRTLSVSTQQGDVNIHELTQNHFKSINVTLNQATLAQHVAIDLAGPDDIAFSDTGGSPIVLDATKVNVSDNNRNFTFSAPMRDVQIDGVSLGSGSYSVYAGGLLLLNSDVTTTGGGITLNGNNGINLLRSVLIDSNTDRTGAGGAVSLSTGQSATISSTGGSRTLTVDSSSPDAAGGSQSINSSVDNRAGAFLSNVSFNAQGASPSTDGAITLGGQNYLINGNFSSIGKSLLNFTNGMVLIDTEQGNVGNAGSISFTGGNVASNLYAYLLRLDASTTAVGANGGNVTLLTSGLGTAFDTSGIDVRAGAGSGGTKGDITLQAIGTTKLLGGPVTQTYNGRTVTLTGNLSTANGNVAITGDVILGNSVTIDTNSTQTGNSGAVTVTGTSISANGTGRNLVIDTTSANGNGGAVSLPVLDAAAGSYVNSLNVNTTRGSGSHGAITLAGVATEGAQTYAGGAAALGGSLSTNGGNVNMAGLTGVTLSGGPFSIATDRAGGTSAAGSVTLGSAALNGSMALTIDTTADGGGAASDIVLGNVGNSTAFSTVTLLGRGITTGQVRSVGDILMEARGATSDVTLNGSVTTTGTGNIVIAAGRNFTNNVTNGLSAGGGGRYLVYSADPASSLEKMSGYNKHYNQTYAAGSTPGYAGSGNWFFYSIAPVISVTSGVPTIVYGNADPTIVLGSSHYSGLIDGDTLANFSGSQTITLAAPGATSSGGHRPVGTYAYNLNGTLTDSLGYQYAAYAENLTVTPRSLAVAGVAAASKVYDGNTTASLGGGTVSAGVLGGDDVGVDTSGAAGSFSDKNVATGKAVTASGYGLSGTDSANYTIVQPTGLTADITPKTLTMTGSAADNKVYDRTTAAAVDVGTLGGLVGGETLAVTAAGTFADRNAGTGKNVAVTYTLGNGTNGGLASNYQLAGETLQADIQQRAVTVAAAGVDRVYDGTSNATATLSSADIIAGDTVNFTGTAAFADRNAGIGKAVAVTGIGSADTDAQNYSFNTTASTTATIGQRALTISGSAAANKTYDGTTGATIAAGTLSGLVGGETVAIAATGTFADKHAGTAKNVAVGYVLEDGANGGLAGNYSLAGETLQADITPKAITVDASAGSKAYDGTTAAVAALASAGIVGADVVNFTGTAAFADRNAGVGKTVNVTGISASGADASNYAVGTTASTTADITPRNLTITGTRAADKTYDGSTAAQVAGGVLAGLVGGETVSAAASGTFADKNAGTDKSVAVTYSLSDGANGGLAGNYALAGETVQASITPKAITVDATALDKVYDGTRHVATNLGSTGVLNGDDVGFTGVGTMADKNVGTGKAVTVAGVTLTGADALNYSAASTAATTVDVTPKTVAVSAAGLGRDYDGSLAAPVALSSGDLVAGDQVGFTGSGTYADKNAGANKAIAVSGIAATGADAGNYSVGNTTASTTGTISPRAIQVSAAGVDKVYDGTRDAQVLLSGAGILGGDQVLVTGQGTFDDRNVGTGKAVTVSGLSLSGGDAANYAVAPVAGGVTTTGNVTPRALGVELVGPVNKDNNTGPTVALRPDQYAITGVVAGDAIALAGVGTFLDGSLGSGKTVTTTVSAADYRAGAGTSLGNYTLFTGLLSAAVGEVADASGYRAALQSLPSIPTGDRLAPSSPDMLAREITDEGGAAIATDGRPSADAVAPAADPRAWSLKRRNLALSQGGIRLPAGLIQD